MLDAFVQLFPAAPEFFPSAGVNFVGCRPSKSSAWLASLQGFVEIAFGKFIETVFRPAQRRGLRDSCGVDASGF